MIAGRRDIGVGAVAILVAALTYFVLIPRGIDLPAQIDTSALAPDFWPRMVMLVLGLTGAVLIVNGVLLQRRESVAGGRAAGGTEDRPDDPPADTDEMRPFFAGSLRTGVVFLWLLGLYYAIPVTGMLAGTMVTLGFMIWFGGERRWRILVPVSVVLPLCLYLFLLHVAQIPLPNGVFESLR